MHKIPSILHLKTYFFYFKPSFLQNTHISLSILQDISIKYYFFSIFYYYSQLPLPTIRALSFSLCPFFFCFIPLSLYPSLYSSQYPFLNRSPLSLSLSLSLFYLLSFFLKNNQPNRPIHQPRQPEFFTTQKLPTQSTDPRTFHSFS